MAFYSICSAHQQSKPDPDCPRCKIGQELSDEEIAAHSKAMGAWGCPTCQFVYFRKTTKTCPKCNTKED